MNTILSADLVNSSTFPLNTDTRCKGRPILVLWESGHSPEDEFGSQIMSQGTTPNAYRYTGQQSDADSGLLYLRARYYEPSTSRFISQDSHPGDYKVPSTLNLYVYCRNNPLTLTDPSGNEPFPSDERTPLNKIVIEPEVKQLLDEIGGYVIGPVEHVDHSTELQLSATVWHHICSNKGKLSTSWTAYYQGLFDTANREAAAAGKDAPKIGLNDKFNKIPMDTKHHKGCNTTAYDRSLSAKLEAATKGKKGIAFLEAVRDTVKQAGQELIEHPERLKKGLEIIVKTIPK